MCQVWTDYSTLGYSLLLSPDKVIAVEPDRVTIKGAETFGCVDCQVRGPPWLGCHCVILYERHDG